MNLYLRNLVLVSVLLLATVSVFGQQVVKEVGMSPMPSLKWEMPAGANMIEVPLSTTEQVTLVPLSVSGSDTLWVALDTGMPHSRAAMLWDRPRVRNMGLEFATDPNMMVMGAGGSGERFQIEIANNVSVNIGDLLFKDMEVHLLPPMPMPFERDAGIIGAALFSNFVVELDYDDEVMRLHRNETFSPGPEWTELPMVLKGGMPFVQASAVLEDGSELPVELVVDLGAAHALSLNTDADERLVLPSDAIEISLGRGLSGKVLGHKARLDSFKLAGHTLSGVTCSFPQSGHQFPGGLADHHGNLGHGILARFNIAHDYARNRILLKPNHRFDQPFRYNTTGMFCKLRDNGYLVDEVLSASPAGEQGVLEGDRVVSIDGRVAASIPYPEMREILQQERKKMDVVLDRDGKAITVSFTTRDLI